MRLTTTRAALCQVLFHVGVFNHRADYICLTMAAAWAGFAALIMDRMVALVLTSAALKIQVALGHTWAIHAGSPRALLRPSWNPWFRSRS